MNRWIAADLEQNPGDYGRPKGLTGKMGNLGGVPGWTQTDPICTDMNDIDMGDGTGIFHSMGEEASDAAQEDTEVATAHVGDGDA